MIKGLLTSPDYSLKDFKAIMVNGYMKNNNLKVHIVENTGHMPGIMMMKKLMDVLTDLAKII